MFGRCLLSLVMTALTSIFPLTPAAGDGKVDPIVALERGALDRWGRGDPGGYLELYARDVTYLHPQGEKRIDGLAAMRQALEPIKGLVKIDNYEMIAPRVDRAGDVAI